MSESNRVFKKRRVSSPRETSQEVYGLPGIFDALSYGFLQTRELTPNQIDIFKSLIEEHGGYVVSDLAACDILLTSKPNVQSPRLFLEPLPKLLRSKTPVSQRIRAGNITVCDATYVSDSMALHQKGRGRVSRGAYALDLKALDTACKLPRPNHVVSNSKMAETSMISTSATSMSNKLDGNGSQSASTLHATHVSTAAQPRVAAPRNPETHSNEAQRNKRYVDAFKILLNEARQQGHIKKYKKKQYTSTIANLLKYREIKTDQDVEDFVNSHNGAGQKTKEKLKEILHTGMLRRADHYAQQDDYKVKKILMNLHGVGDALAASWYEAGVRSIDDVHRIEDFGCKPLTIQQRTALAFYDDTSTKMERAELEAIRDVVTAAAVQVWPGIQVVICGSYRRTLPHDTVHKYDDVDFLFYHPDHKFGESKGAKKFSQFLSELIVVLGGQSYTKGITRGAVYDGSTSRSSTSGDIAEPFIVAQLSTTPDKFMGICRLPSTNAHYSGKGRRIDMIMRHADTQAFGLLYFSSGVSFMRGVAQFAQDKRRLHLNAWHLAPQDVNEINFSNDVHHMEKAPRIPCATEEDIFSAIGLDYITPYQRSQGFQYDMNGKWTGE